MRPADIVIDQQSPEIIQGLWKKGQGHEEIKVLFFKMNAESEYE